MNARPLPNTLALIIIAAALSLTSAGCRLIVGDDLAIVVSPNVLYVGAQGEWVTVHAEIAFITVDRATVELNGIPAVSTFADLRGELVAKFEIEDVMAIVAPPAATLELTGLTLSGQPFSGTAIVEVRD